MKYSKFTTITIVTVVLLTHQLLYGGISVNSTGLNQGVNKTIKKAEKFVKKEQKEAERIAEVNSIYKNSIDFVQIEAECINGLIPCIEKNLQVSGGPGRFEANFNQAYSGAIYKDYQGNIAGTYSFSVQFDNNICTGNFYISGHKKHYKIALGKDCHNNGSGEW